MSFGEQRFRAGRWPDGKHYAIKHFPVHGEKLVYGDVQAMGRSEVLNHLFEPRTVELIELLGRRGSRAPHAHEELLVNAVHHTKAVSKGPIEVEQQTSMATQASRRSGSRRRAVRREWLAGPPGH